MDMEREEGEMSDDNEMLVDEKLVSINDDECTVLYKAEKNGLVVNKLDRIDASRLEERAKRFGLNLSGNRIVTQKQIDELYANCGIEGDNERHFRFDTLHLNGVEGLSTKEIFEYLEDYKPVSLEWIDDRSCNIVCHDHISAALALLVHSRELQNEELKQILGSKSLHYWREGMPHPKNELILMRFATNGDKKMGRKKSQRLKPNPYNMKSTSTVEAENKNPWGDLCKSWGVYDHQEVFHRKLPKIDSDDDDIEESYDTVQIKNKRLAMRLGKRRHKNEDHDERDSDSDTEWKKKSKTPRMRMHADDEESKKKNAGKVECSENGDRDTYAPLSIEVINNQSTVYTPRVAGIVSEKFKNSVKTNSIIQKHSLRSRLGAKVMPQDFSGSSSSDEYSSDDSDHNIMSRVQKVDNHLTQSSVWSRLEEKPRCKSDQLDLRDILKTKKHEKKPDDLRERIARSKKTNLRIEIDNNFSD